MRRSDLLFVVGMSATTFNALATRDLLPFARSSKGWATFLVEDAIKLALFLDLSSVGLPQARASELVRTRFDDLLDYVNSKSTSESRALFFGEIALRASGKASVDSLQHIALITEMGRFDRSISKAVEEAAAGWHVASIDVINATDTMDRLLQGFKAAGSLDLEVRKWSAFLRVPEAKKWRGALA